MASTDSPEIRIAQASSKRPIVAVHLLLVDDEKRILNTVGKVLRLLCCKVTSANTAYFGHGPRDLDNLITKRNIEDLDVKPGPKPDVSRLDTIKLMEYLFLP